MKDLAVYYIKILLPLPIIALFAGMDFTWTFVSLLLFYALVYRTIVDSEKLIEQGAMAKNERWKLMLPFWHIKYFRELYLR